jgi:chromosome segregation ATPase
MYTGNNGNEQHEAPHQTTGLQAVNLVLQSIERRLSELEESREKQAERLRLHREINEKHHEQLNEHERSILALRAELARRTQDVAAPPMQAENPERLKSAAQELMHMKHRETIKQLRQAGVAMLTRSNSRAQLIVEMMGLLGLKVGSPEIAEYINAIDYALESIDRRHETTAA